MYFSCLSICKLSFPRIYRMPIVVGILYHIVQNTYYTDRDRCDHLLMIMEPIQFFHISHDPERWFLELPIVGSSKKSVWRQNSETESCFPTGWGLCTTCQYMVVLFPQTTTRYFGNVRDRSQIDSLVITPSDSLLEMLFLGLWLQTFLYFSKNDSTRRNSEDYLNLRYNYSLDTFKSSCQWIISPRMQMANWQRWSISIVMKTHIRCYTMGAR